MSQHPDNQQFDESTADRVDPSNVFPIRPDIAQDQKPAPSKKKRKVHPPSEPRPHFKGKHQDSPYYIEPVTGRKFIEAMAEDDELPPAGLRAAILVMGHYNHLEGVARPGEQGIADRLKKQRTYISECLNKVAERGWLQIISTRIGNRNGPNHYVPVLAKAGLSFGKTRQSAAPIVEFSESDCRVSPALTVGFSEPSLSTKPDMNLKSEPTELNPEKEPKGSAAAQQAEAPVDFDGKKDRPAREPKIELSVDFQPDPEAVKAAIERGCTQEQIDASIVKWRGHNAGKSVSMTEWKRKSSAWLARENPKPKSAPDTTGTVLPKSWKPTNHMWAHAISLGLTQKEVSQTNSTFDLYYEQVSGPRALSRDWEANWVLWMEREAKRKQEKRQGPAGVGTGRMAI